MENNIFLPKTIRVGCQKRNGTYTGKLAYIIYIDQKGKVRKETSWNSWRDQKIKPEDFDNVPTEGFVLNKKVGGDSWSGWNHRQTYCRVYDPRGFEFEINVENLLYVLEHTSSIKGKGLEGEFVYGWSGTELILIPTSSPDYVELAEYNKTLHSAKKFKLADMIEGATYLTKDNRELVYMGRYERYDYEWRDDDNPIKKGKSYFFFDPKGESLELVKTLSQKLISCVSEDCVSNYTDLFDALEKKREYCPVDKTKDKKVFYKQKNLKAMFHYQWRKDYSNRPRLMIGDRDAVIDVNSSFDFDVETGKISQSGYRAVPRNPDSTMSRYHWNNTRSERYTNDLGTLKEFIAKYKPYYINRYLENGKVYTKVTS
jgi:hypothetical protein